MTYQILNFSSPNYWPGRNGEKVIAIVNHIAAGGYEGSRSWLCRTNGDSSAHFIISETGEISQMVSTDNAAWGNGIVNQPNLTIPWLADCIRAGKNPNNLTISIEHAGFPLDQNGNAIPIPEAQYRASLWLQKSLIAKYGIIPDRNHIIRHADIDNVNRHNCPGPAFPLARLIKDLQGGQPVPTNRSRTFSETGFTINDPFLAFWESHGGLEILGLPIKSEEDARNYNLGFEGSVQWLERSRLEYHNADGKIYLGLIGSELLAKI